MHQQQQARQRVQAAWLLLLLLQLSSLPPLHATSQEDGYLDTAEAASDMGASTSRSGSSSSSSSSGSRDSGQNFGYIITLTHDPVVSYKGGGPAGMAATAQAADSGGRLDVTSAAAAAYSSFLETASVSVASRAGIAASSATYQYRYIAAGFAVAERLTQRQIDALRRDREVLAVTENKIFSVRTLTTPSFLGLAGTGKNGRGGVWDQLGAQFGGPARAGENIVIGIVDSGIWPEHPSFSDRQNLTSNNAGPYAYTPLDRQQFRGHCVAGEDFAPSQCTRKLVGCQHFSKSFGPSGGVKALYPTEVESCRDVASHGTHVAATAAGNYGVRFRDGILSGMAPRARIAAYKVCWGDGACPLADVVAALDEAVADGVDVINLSLGYNANEFPDLLATTLMQVARAGIFVAAAAGNEGPDQGSVQNASPWITTVAASSHNRAFRATVVLSRSTPGGKLLTLVGSGYYIRGVVVTPVILAEQGAIANANMARAAQCYLGSLDAAKVRGKVVVCDRSGNSRAEKAAAVAKAGGVGMLLLNTPSGANWAAAQRYAVPTVHLLAEYRDRVREYVSAAGAAARARFLPIVQDDKATAPVVTAFSSRGPEPSSGGSVLKPDLSAPGLDIAAAASPKDKTTIRDAAGNAFALMSGTSMSSPHIAGLAALMRQLHPTWSPMAIKSAMMTTTYRLTITGNTSLPIGESPFAFGSGHVNPDKMLNPGLIFDSGFEDWSKFACAAARPANIDLPASIRNICGGCGPATAFISGCTTPADLNLPSISLPSIVLGSTKIVMRRVTSVLNVTATFRAAQQAPSASASLRVDSITPQSFSLAPGQSQDLEVAVRISDAALGGGWVFAAAALQSDQGTFTRIPIAAKASDFEAPQQLRPAKDATTFNFPVLPGWQGTLDINNLGLAAPLILRGSMLSNNRDGNLHNISIPAGISVIRISMFTADLQPASCCDLDLDLYLRMSQGFRVIGRSWNPRAEDEQIYVRSPDPGRYTVRVIGYDEAPRRVIYFVYVWMLKGSTSSSSGSSTDNMSLQGLSVNDVISDAGEQAVTSSNMVTPASAGDASDSGDTGDTASNSSGVITLNSPTQQQQQQQQMQAVTGVSMEVTPSGRTPVIAGQGINMQLNLRGLQFGGVPPKRYFGMLDYVRGKEDLGSTRIDIV